MATRSIPVLINPVPGGGARVASLTEFGTNQQYSTNGIYFPDKDGAKVQLAFQIPADYVTSPEFVLYMGSIGQDQTVRWRVEYNVIDEFQSYDPATVDEQLHANEGEGANPTRLRVVEFAATAGNFAAESLCLANLIRLSTAGSDDSYAGVMVAGLAFRYSDT